MKTNINLGKVKDAFTNTQSLKKIASASLIAIFTINMVSPLNSTGAGSNDIIYPLKEVAKLECRFNDFDTLGSDCLENLPILYTKDYVKYATQNGGYNDFTRRYTMLWGASYKYGWDIGNGGHMGVDIATAKGTPAYSMADGTVIVASNLGSLGNTVAIKHTINGKEIVSSYSHLSKIDVSKGDKIGVGRKIGEVGSTGNSTGNHLHFQIDIDTKSSPAYYSYESCPYSYYKITEEGVCFGELQRLTVDPLLFLESKGAVLNNLPSYNNNSGNNSSGGTSSNNNNNKPNTILGIDKGIFNKAVNVGSSATDIKNVQTIIKDLGYYKGEINGNYNDVYESLIDYQVARGVIDNRDDDGAGNWGPKTRTQAKADYELFAATGATSSNGNTNQIDNPQEEPENNNEQGNDDYNQGEQIIISKDKLMTREEIEAKEVEDFMKDYNLELKFRNLSSNVKVGGTEILDLTVTDKKKGKPFVGNMPGGMTFVVDETTVDMFPTKLFNFTDGKREIQITGLKEGTTKLHIQVGNVTIATYDINVYNGQKTIYPETVKLISPKTTVIGDSQTALAFFRDSNGNLLVNLPFGSTFKLQASEGNKVCIKKGNMNDIKSVVNSKCDNQDFKESIEFTYDDTISGILVYEYKALNKNANFSILNTYNNTNLAKKSIAMIYPKGIDNSYEYRNDVITMLEKGIVSGVNSGYFQENNNLTEYDAYTWLKSSLNTLASQTTNQSTLTKINKNLKELTTQQNTASKYNSINRKQFLALAYNYLVLDGVNVDITIYYKDLDETENKLANYIFSKNNTWKDEFGNNYFQPEKNMTRGEGAYMLATVFNNYSNNYLTLK